MHNDSIERLAKWAALGDRDNGPGEHRAGVAVAHMLSLMARVRLEGTPEQRSAAIEYAKALKTNSGALHPEELEKLSKHLCRMMGWKYE